jgi:hypothetical protein
MINGSDPGDSRVGARGGRKAPFFLKKRYIDLVIFRAFSGKMITLAVIEEPPLELWLRNRTQVL